MVSYAYNLKLSRVFGADEVVQLVERKEQEKLDLMKNLLERKDEEMAKKDEAMKDLNLQIHQHFFIQGLKFILLSQN